MKSKMDLNCTENRKRVLSSLEKEFLKLVKTDENPAYNKLGGAMTVGFKNEKAPTKISKHSNSLPEIMAYQSTYSARSRPISRRSTSCKTTESAALSHPKLQRVFTVEQLKFTCIKIQTLN